jgi:hypothetical protein
MRLLANHLPLALAVLAAGCAKANFVPVADGAADAATARDCLMRNTCVNNACLPGCSDAHTCASGQTCHPLGSDYGYCA